MNDTITEAPTAESDFEGSAKAYLESSDKAVAVVFDLPSREALHLLLPTAGFPKYLLLCNIDSVAEVIGGSIELEEWLTFSVHDEPALRLALTTLLARNGRAQAVVKTLHVAPGHSVRSAKAASRIAGSLAHAAPPLAYAIVCTPRSGSTYFAQLLGSAGFGFLREHLRNPEVARIVDLKLTDTDAKARFIEYMHSQKRDDIFGTKVISQYLFAVLKRASIPKTLRNYIRNNVSIVYLVRRDKVGQALSDFLARKSQIWHTNDAQSLEAMAEVHGKVEYSFEGILRRYTVAMNEDRRLVKLIRRMRYCVLFYEDICDDPVAAVAAVGKFLDRPVARESRVKVQKLESVTAQQFRERFNSDYQAKFGHLPEEYVPYELLETE